jgi:hypothetical protein
VEHEVGSSVPIDVVFDLLIVYRTESTDHQSLGFTPGKKGRTVCERQAIDFACNLTDVLCAPTIGPQLVR